MLENTNPVFHSNNTLSYVPRRTVKFIPEMSVGDPKNLHVIVPNIAMLVSAENVKKLRIKILL